MSSPDQSVNVLINKKQSLKGCLTLSLILWYSLLLAQAEVGIWKLHYNLPVEDRDGFVIDSLMMQILVYAPDIIRSSEDGIWEIILIPDTYDSYEKSKRISDVFWSAGSEIKYPHIRIGDYFGPEDDRQTPIISIHLNKDAIIPESTSLLNWKGFFPHYIRSGANPWKALHTGKMNAYLINPKPSYGISDGSLLPGLDKLSKVLSAHFDSSYLDHNEDYHFIIPVNGSLTNQACPDTFEKQRKAGARASARSIRFPIQFSRNGRTVMHLFICVDIELWDIDNGSPAHIGTAELIKEIPLEFNVIPPIYHKPESEFSCGDLFTDIRDRQQYKSVQIGNYCWMADNLNVGRMLKEAANTNSTNGISKSCYEHKADNCFLYGGLYDWSTMTNLQAENDSIGICPPGGWYIPSDDDWQYLEGFIDSQYGVGDKTWRKTFYRGYDIGARLKAATSNCWKQASAIVKQQTGFSAVFAGYYDKSGTFGMLGNYAYFWTSTAFDKDFAWSRLLLCERDDIMRITNEKSSSFSVRCVRKIEKN